MKKIICLIFLFLAVSSSCYAFDISAESAILYDCLTDTFIYEKNADTQRPIASTTKIMTGLIASTIYDVNQEITVKSEWCGIEGSSMYLAPGEKLKISDLIYGLLLVSGNDAAVALSLIYDNNTDSFVDLMNEKAAEIGLSNTHFDNPTGLDSKTQYSTARDLAKLTKYALSNEYFAKVCSTKQASIGTRFLANHNKLLFLIKDVIGVKTGYTDEAGRCLVSAINKDGRTFIAVTLNAPDDWEDHKKMYEFAYNDIKERTVVQKGLIGYIDVAGKGQTPVYIKNNILLNISHEELDFAEISLKGQRIAYSGFSADEQYGILTIRLNGKIIHTEPVYYQETIIKDTPKYTLWEKIIRFFSKR